MNGKAFQWIATGLLAIVIALIGYIAASHNSRLDDANERLNRANGRLQNVCERIALLESKTGTLIRTCGVE